MKPFYALFALSLLVCVNANAARFWVATTASDWNNTANWSTSSGGAGGASVPGPTDNVTFNNSRNGNCTIDVPVSIMSLTVNGYTGTIFQGANTLSTVNNASFSTGIFSGGSANITIGKNFTIAGANFTSTSGTLEFDGNSAFTSGTFTHNNGSVRYNPAGSINVTGNSPAFFNLELVGKGFNYNITSTANITVANTLTVSGTLSYKLNTGTIDALGDINITNTAAGCAGTGLVEIVGTGTQNFSGSSSAGEGALPQLTINKPSGTLNLTNFPASSNAFNYMAGTVNAGASTWCFTDGSANPYTITGTLTLNHITFLALTSATFTVASTLTAAGDLALAGTSNITLKTGTLNVNGNINLNNTGTNGGGTATIQVIGSGNATIDGTAIAEGESALPFVVIARTGGTLSLKGNISSSQDWTFTSGTVNASSFVSTVAFGGNSLNLASAGMSFYNVDVIGNTVTLTNNLTVNNDLTITAGKIAPGSNTINLAGNWNNYGTAGFTEGTSTVVFNGTSIQALTSPGGENFNNVTVNNSGGGIQLANNTVVEAGLNMTMGDIDLNGNNLALGQSVANNGTMARTAGSIINTGSFTRWFKPAAIAGSLGLFPMGTSTDYRPFSISTTASPTAGGTITVAYNDAATNTAVTIADGASTVFVRKDLNWTLTTGNGLANGTYNLQAQGTGLGQIGNVADLRLTLANGIVGTAGTNAGTTANPQVNRTGLSAANLNNSFFIGSVSLTSPLPITLLNFTGSVVNGEVVLHWSTSSEINNAGFTVQRSKDGIQWQNGQNVAGAGTSGLTNYYSATDANPYQGVSYYRLLQTDLDGKQTYSPILSFEIGNKGMSISIYPIPASQQLTIGLPSPGSTSAAKYEINLFNSAGSLVQSRTATGGNNVVLNVASLTAGVYYILVKGENATETRTVLIGK